MEFFDFLLSFEHYLPILIQQYGLWIYALLFLIIFCETAFVFMFFLPGESLLLAIGALCSTIPMMNLGFIIILLSIAATLGYMVNYHIGRRMGVRIFEIKSRLIKHEHLLKTHDYFKRHGALTILVARFIPFVRSFAPFAAGSSGMNYSVFSLYNIVGAFIWIALLVTAGYLLGHTVMFIGDIE